MNHNQREYKMRHHLQVSTLADFGVASATIDTDSLSDYPHEHDNHNDNHHQHQQQTHRTLLQQSSNGKRGTRKTYSFSSNMGGSSGLGEGFTRMSESQRSSHSHDSTGGYGEDVQCKKMYIDTINYYLYCLSFLSPICFISMYVLLTQYTLTLTVHNVYYTSE